LFFTFVNHSSSTMKSVCLASFAVACSALNIVELAQATPELSTLVAAVVAADLVDILSGPGSFTVFCPTNDAFDALPAGLLSYLLEPENKAQLAEILTYHVLTQEYRFSEEKFARGPGGVFNTVAGKPLAISSLASSGVGAIGAPQSVSATNIAADNGVVHIIDGVMGYITTPSLVESGRSFSIDSFKQGFSRTASGPCGVDHQKGHVDLHEGACYQRQFNGTSGTGATGNDQRAFCSTTYGSGGRVLKTQLLSYQYSSSDGTCQDPRGDENARPVTDAETALNQIRQGSNNFLSGSCNTDLFGEILRFQCPEPDSLMV